MRTRAGDGCHRRGFPTACRDPNPLLVLATLLPGSLGNEDFLIPRYPDWIGVERTNPTHSFQRASIRSNSVELPSFEVGPAHKRDPLAVVAPCRRGRDVVHFGDPVDATTGEIHDVEAMHGGEDELRSIRGDRGPSDLSQLDRSIGNALLEVNEGFDIDRDVYLEWDLRPLSPKARRFDRAFR